MQPTRRHLRRRLALEFILIAGAIHLILIVAIIGVREGQLRQQFDSDLLRRTERIAGAAAQDLVPPSAVPEAVQEETVPPGVMPLMAQAQSLEGEVISSTPALDGVLLPLSPEAETQVMVGTPYFATIDGAEFGRPGERFRTVTVYEEGPPPYFLHTVVSQQPVAASVAALRRLLFVLALPGAMVGTGVAAWLISGHVVRRIDEAAREAQLGRARASTSRVGIPTGSDEIGGMMSDMNSMLSRLENAFRAQERFIVDVTHELKTPVSVMLAEAQVLKKSRSVDAERYREFVASVEEEMRRLGSLLESFLTLARSGHGPRYVSESLVEISDVVLDAIQRCDAAARERDVALRYVLPGEEEEDPAAVKALEAGIAVRGDQELLTTLVANLVRNAVENSVSGTQIGIRLRLVDAQVKVHIEYTAVPYDADAPGVRGRELAFNVAKGIAELHGGEVHTVQRGEHGEASLRLPIVQAA